LAQHAQDHRGLLDLASLTELASPKALALSGPLLPVLVILDTTVRQRVPLALAWVHGRAHVVDILQVPAQVAVLVLAWLERSTADWAEQQLGAVVIVAVAVAHRRRGRAAWGRWRVHPLVLDKRMVRRGGAVRVQRTSLLHVVALFRRSIGRRLARILSTLFRGPCGRPTTVMLKVMSIRVILGIHRGRIFLVLDKRRSVTLANGSNVSGRDLKMRKGRCQRSRENRR